MGSLARCKRRFNLDRERERCQLLGRQDVRAAEQGGEDGQRGEGEEQRIEAAVAGEAVV